MTKSISDERETAVLRPKSQRVRRALHAAAVVLALLLTTATPAVADPPSLRLIAADDHLRIGQDELAYTMHVGLWIAATDGDFRMRVQRPGYGAWQAAQVDAVTGAALRSVPNRLVARAGGFKDFIKLTFRDSRGHVALRRTLDFCPSAGERVSDDGPPESSYSGVCGSGFPFALGTVWGIDRGWASAMADGTYGRRGKARRMKPGRYRVDAQIGGEFRRVFAIPPGQSKATVRVRVVRARKSDAHRFPVATARATAAVPTDVTPDPATVPDLVALPPWDISVRNRRHHQELRFAATPWNAGPAPLVVEGFRTPGQDVLQAFQYFTSAEGEVTARAPAGTMEYHAGEGHDHWHFRQFVSYRLLTSSGRQVVRAHKEAFCLAPTDAVDLTVPHAVLAPNFIGLESSTCGDQASIWLRESLPAGWGDTYSPGVGGQSFDISKVKNGRYMIEMRVNPLGALHETTTANNIARREIVLSGRQKRRVRVLPWHGIRG